MNLVFAQPVGVGHDVQRPPLAPVATYTVGLGLGGAITGLAVSALGTTMRGATGTSTLALAAAAGVIIIAGLVGEWRGRVWPLPERKRQVPARWLQWQHRTATGFAFGLLLGMGVWTLLHHAAAYVAFGCLLLVSPFIGAAAGALYGASRALLLASAWLSIGHERQHRRLSLITLPRSRELLILVGVAVSLTIIYITVGR